MTLMTIKDFRARPCAIEYLTLYIATSSVLLALAAATFGQLAASWAISIAIYVALSVAFLGSCRIKRHARARQFYMEWLQSLSKSDFESLKHRLKPGTKERELVSKLHAKPLLKRPTLA